MSGKDHKQASSSSKAGDKPQSKTARKDSLDVSKTKKTAQASQSDRISLEVSDHSVLPDDESKTKIVDESSKTRNEFTRHKKNGHSRRAEMNITVETPDGQRIVMRSRPDQTIKHLLEACCRRVNVNPNEHYLVFDHKELNESEKLSTKTFAQSDVLKLFKGKKTVLHRKIRVIVKVRDVRIGSMFSDTDNLWYIIKVLLAKEYIDADLVPVVLYNKEEFIGVELLSRVRLRDIGVTIGTCNLKFLQLKKEDLELRGVKTEDDEVALTTLESLEMLAAGPTQDTGLRAVTFKLEDESQSWHYIGERKALAFKLVEVTEEEVVEVLKDEYFNLTEEEISVFLLDLLKKHPDLEKMNPKVAIAIVRSEMDGQISRKPDVSEILVRIQLPDRMALQAVFSPDETVNDVKIFVRKFVREDIDEFEIYRYDYTSLLKPATTLREFNCGSCLKLYMALSDRHSVFEENVLQEDLNVVSRASADELAIFTRGESLEQFFSSFDRDSFAYGKSGASGAGLRMRSKKHSFQSFFSKSSSAAQRHLRKSYDKDSTSKASASSSASRGRRSTAGDPRLISSFRASHSTAGEDEDSLSDVNAPGPSTGHRRTSTVLPVDAPHESFDESEDSPTGSHSSANGK